MSSPKKRKIILKPTEKMSAVKVSVKPVASQLKVEKKAINKFVFKIQEKSELYSKEITLRNGGKVSVKAITNANSYGKIVPKGNAKTESADGWNCEIKPWSGEIVSKEAAVLNNNFTKLYVGSIYKYESIADGSYQSLPYKRKPITIVATALNFQSPAKTVSNPSMSTIQTAVNSMVNSKTGRGSAKTFGQKFKVLSEEDLFIRTAGSGYFLGFGGSHDIKYKTSNKSHKYFIELYQNYYTISVDDTVHNPGDFFYLKSEHPENTDALSDLQVDPNWVYVDSVTYGRILRVMFESDWSFESVGIDIEAHANLLVAGGDASFNMQQKSILSKTSVTVLAIGGDPVYSAQTLNASNLQELGKRIDNYMSGTNDEAAISFTLRTLNQRSVGARLTTEFTSRNCSPSAKKYEITWNKIVCRVADDGSGGEEIRAMVRIRAFDSKGKDIMDVDRKNQKVIAIAEQKKIVKALVVPFTFSKGTEKNPLHMNTGDFYNMEQKITFPFDANDKNAKIGIRVDVLEYDGWGDSNDDFTDAAWERKISELKDSETIVLTCNHDKSRIDFYMSYRAIY